MNFIISKLANYVLILDKLQNGMSDSSKSCTGCTDHHHSPGPEKSWIKGTQRQFLENICSEDDLRSRILETFVVKFLACLSLLRLLAVLQDGHASEEIERSERNGKTCRA